MAVRESSGSPELDANGLAAVALWRLQPALRDGRPVEAIYHVGITYKPTQ